MLTSIHNSKITTICIDWLKKYQFILYLKKYIYIYFLAKIIFLNKNYNYKFINIEYKNQIFLVTQVNHNNKQTNKYTVKIQ